VPTPRGQSNTGGAGAERPRLWVEAVGVGVGWGGGGGAVGGGTCRRVPETMIGTTPVMISF
jgi:hypothetical protein